MATTMPNPAEQTPAAEPQQTAPPVQAQVEPPAPQLFERTPLEDGKFQVRLNTGEIFTGTNDELVEKLAGSAAHTHNYGRKLKTELDTFKQQPPAQQTNAPQQAPVDPAEQMIADIAARSMGFNNAAEQREAYHRLNSNQQEIQGRMVANQFMAENPDFGPSEHNSQVLTDLLGGMPETPRNLAMAHAYAKNMNLYEQVSTQPRGNTFQRPQVPASMPNGSSPQNAPAMTEADMWKMPMEELRALQAKR